MQVLADAFKKSTSGARSWAETQIVDIILARHTLGTFFRYPFRLDENRCRDFKPGYFLRVLINQFPQKVSDISGDRLDLLAQRFYQDVTKWWIIAEANSLEVLSFEVKPGLQLRIPQNNGY